MNLKQINLNQEKKKMPVKVIYLKSDADSQKELHDSMREEDKKGRKIATNTLDKKQLATDSEPSFPKGD